MAVKSTFGARIKNHPFVAWLALVLSVLSIVFNLGKDIHDTAVTYVKPSIESSVGYPVLDYDSARSLITWHTPYPLEMSATVSLKKNRAGFDTPAAPQKWERIFFPTNITFSNHRDVPMTFDQPTMMIYLSSGSMDESENCWEREPPRSTLPIRVEPYSIVRAPLIFEFVASSDSWLPFDEWISEYEITFIDHSGMRLSTGRRPSNLEYSGTIGALKS